MNDRCFQDRHKRASGLAAEPTLSRAIQDRLGRELRDMYAEIQRDTATGRLADLVRQLEHKDSILRGPCLARFKAEGLAGLITPAAPATAESPAVIDQVIALRRQRLSGQHLAQPATVSRILKRAWNCRDAASPGAACR